MKYDKRVVKSSATQIRSKPSNSTTHEKDFP